MEAESLAGRPSMLGRGLALLQAFGDGETLLTLTELAKRTGLPKPTVHRLVAELLAWGGLERSGRHLRLGRRVVTLGLQAPFERRLRDAADPHLPRLCESPRHSAHFGVLDADLSTVPRVLILARLVPKRAGVPCPPLLPVHSCAIGRVLLAHGPPDPVRRLMSHGLPRRTQRTMTSRAALLTELARIRRRGYAVSAGETVAGMTAVAVPVFAGGLHAVGAVAVAGRSGHIDVRQTCERVRAVCEELSEELCLRPPAR